MMCAVTKDREEHKDVNITIDQTSSSTSPSSLVEAIALTVKMRYRSS